VFSHDAQDGPNARIGTVVKEGPRDFRAMMDSTGRRGEGFVGKSTSRSGAAQMIRRRWLARQP
jgi:hypothetical protein